MKMFEEPEVLVKTFEIEDILTASNEDVTPWG